MKTDYIYHATPGKDSGESWRFDNFNLLTVLYFLIELWGFIIPLLTTSYLLWFRLSRRLHKVTDISDNQWPLK